VSTFSPNKNIEEPASGSYNNAWAMPVNANWTLIDTAFGGTTSIVVTGITGPSITLSSAQYTPPNIEFTGTLSAALNYILPSGVGGLWSIYNNTTGAFTLLIFCQNTGGGTSVLLPQGQRSFVNSDGFNVALAQNVATALSQLSGQVSNAQVPLSAVTQWEADLALNFAQIAGVNTVSQIPQLPASKITSGTIANAQLPNAASMPGVTIAADPGTTPSGAPGAIFYYY
jgi:hypothetical protein